MHEGRVRRLSLLQVNNTIPASVDFIWTTLRHSCLHMTRICSDIGTMSHFVEVGRPIGFLSGILKIVGSVTDAVLWALFGNRKTNTTSSSADWSQADFFLGVDELMKQTDNDSRPCWPHGVAHANSTAVDVGDLKKWNNAIQCMSATTACWRLHPTCTNGLCE